MNVFERVAPERHDTLQGVPEPSENPHLIGHEGPATMLASAYRAGRLPHALLFSGPAGIGKATLAFHLAHHLLRHPRAEDASDRLSVPDPSSALFRQIALAAHPSVLHLTRPPADNAKGFKSAVTVDEIRKVSRFLHMTSHDGGYRVVIVDPAEDMNAHAANALLKSLEEPPTRTVFVLVAQGALLPTVRSRCQTIRLSPLAPGELFSVLEAVGQAVPAPDGERRSLVARAEGSARRAILLARHGGLDIAEAVERLTLSKKLDVAGRHRLAERVGARDGEIGLELFNKHVLDLLSKAAADAAFDRDLGRAARFAREWMEARAAIEETQTYNLERKQHALTMLARLQEAFRM